MSQNNKKELEKQLWNIANELRGKMDADEFRDYILGFIFYKYLSEKLTFHINKILEPEGYHYEKLNLENKDHREIIEELREEVVEDIGYFLLPNELFNVVVKRGQGEGQSEQSDNFILEDLTTVLNNITNSTQGTKSEDDFNHLFEDLDLGSTKLGRSPIARNQLIIKVLTHLSNIDFQLHQSQRDVLGDAYEYLISKFASGAGKKAGEFYTPQEVSKILAKIVTTDKNRLKSIYDPTCGSGSLLLRVAKEVQEVGNYYGQELNRTTYNLARMNMILHGVRYNKFDIRQDDTLINPRHGDQEFEAIVANPPFSAKWTASDHFMQDPRFSQYGKLAPSSKADYAFIGHMVYHLAENGTMAVVMPHGVLFRGGAEGVIRQHLIKEKNYLDAVIGLPANIFYGTSIPTCIMVFKKCRTSPSNILFVDGSQGFEKAKNQNHLREGDITKIIETYRDRAAIDKYSYVAELSEIEENDYNLNIPRYVDTFEEEEPIDIEEVATKIRDIDSQMEEVNKQITNYCDQLNINTPF